MAAPYAYKHYAGNLHFWRGAFLAERYMPFLEQHMLPSMPRHILHITTACLSSKRVVELSRLENVWHIIKHKICNRDPGQQLKSPIRQGWERISLSKFQQLCPQFSNASWELLDTFNRYIPLSQLLWNVLLASNQKHLHLLGWNFFI